MGLFLFLFAHFAKHGLTASIGLILCSRYSCEVFLFSVNGEGIVYLDLYIMPRRLG